MQDNTTISNVQILMLKFFILNKIFQQNPSYAAETNKIQTSYFLSEILQSDANDRKKAQNKENQQENNIFLFKGSLHFLRAMAFQEAQGQI